ncbi:MAG: tetratricopeptide repeat protein [Candidatus Limnocylindria bacterium]
MSPRIAARAAERANVELAERIGARLREARLRSGMSQQQLAGDRYTKAFVSAIEHGASRPSMAALTFFAERLGVSPASLLGHEPPGWNRLEADMQLAIGNWRPAADAYLALLETETEPIARAELLCGAAEALCRLDRGREAIAAASEASELFSRAGLHADGALATYWLAFGLYQTDNGDEARALLRGLLDRLRAGLDADPDLRVRVLIALSLVESRAGEHATAVTYLEEARGLAGDLDDRRRASFLFSLAISYRETGDNEAAIRAGTQSLALYRAAGAAFETASIENDLALAYLALGNLTRASELTDAARRQFEATGDARWLAHVSDTQAQIALADGRVDTAVDRAAEAIAFAERSSNDKALGSALLTRARAARRAGRLDAAAADFERAASLLRARGPRARLREALREWADVAADTGEHEQAYRLAREALDAEVSLPT